MTESKPGQENFIRKNNVDLLHFAARAGWVNTIIKCLREFEHDINSRDKQNRTPLHNAVEGNAIRSVHFLLQYRFAKVDVNALAYEKQLTPLSIATTERNALCVKALIEHLDIDPNVTCSQHETALYKAVSRNQLEVSKIICSHPETRVDIPDHYGSTPLHIAAYRGNEDLVAILLSHATCDVFQKDNAGLSAKDCVLNDQQLDEEKKNGVLKLLNQYEFIGSTIQ